MRAMQSGFFKTIATYSALLSRISNQTRSSTTIITITSQISVAWPEISFMKIRTKMGTRTNSNNIKSVSSAAIRYRDAIMKKAFGIAETKLPSKMHNSKSGNEMLRSPPRIMRLMRLIFAPEIKRAGIISILRLRQTVIAKAGKHPAVNKAIMFL